MLYLEKIGVDGRTLFSSIPTQCGGFEFLGHKLGDFPNAEYTGDHGVHVGVHQNVGQDDVDWLINKVGEFILRREKN
jgi:hypothetical protein